MTLLPCTNSEIFGNHVPHATVKQSSTKRRLLNRKLDSREIKDSSLCSLRRCSLFLTKKKMKTAKMMARKYANQLPMEDCAKAWTEAMMPLRVRNVPQIASQNEPKTSHMFQTFSIPRFSCIMTECRNAVPNEPGHERSVLDGVPSPVAAPAENGVGPVGAEEDAAGEESPGDHGPAAGDVDPFFAGILHDQRAQREGEGHGGSDVAQVQHRRMDDHLGILQQGIQAAAIGAQRAFEQAERVGGEIHQREKKDLHAGENHRRVGEQARIGLVTQAQDEAVSG